MAHKRSLPARLDPRLPLVLDTRELGRRAGSMRTVQRTAPAPEQFGIDLIHVPVGGRLDLDLRLESVLEGVLVSGTVDAELAGECARCLDPFTDRIQVPIQELFVYPDSTTDTTSEQDEVGRLEQDLIDLVPVVRDATVLALPLTPLCREDCPGLCAGCGQRREDLPADHGHTSTDPRWAALAERFGAHSEPPPPNG